MISFLLSRVVYIIVSLLFLGGVTAELFIFSKKIKVAILSSILVVFFLLGVLKGQSVGLDTQKYSEMYQNLGSSNSPFSYVLKKAPELLFYFMMVLFSNILKLPEVCFWILEYFVICIFLFFSFYKKNNSIFKITIFMFLGFLMMSLSGIRQSIAISIGTFAITNLVNNRGKVGVKKYIIFYILSLVCIFIHASSFILLPIPLLFLIKWNKRAFALWLLPFLFIPSILCRIFSFISSNFYVDYYPYNYSVSITFVLTIILLVALNVSFRKEKIVLNMFSLIKYEPIAFDDRVNSIIWIVFYSLFFLSTNSFSLVIPRYSMFFYIGTVEIIYLLISGFQNTKFYKPLLIIVASFFAIYFVVRSSTLGIVPYVFR